MRVRIKFAKTGLMKYIGHLDVMRYFQKVIRRADIDIAYSEGFSPHMLMSFAQPLGVGITSDGEYFDMDLKTSMPSAKIIDSMNEQMSDEINVSKAVSIPMEKKYKGMTLVAAADYIVSFKENDVLFNQNKDKLTEFLSQPSINVLKKTKRSESITDIKPYIFESRVLEDQIHLKLSTGSVNNLKPQLLFQAFFEYAQIEPSQLSIHRKEIYADIDGKYIPLYEMGEEIL